MVIVMPNTVQVSSRIWNWVDASVRLNEVFGSVSTPLSANRIKRPVYDPAEIINIGIT